MKKRAETKVRKSNEWRPNAKQICIAQLLVNPDDKRTKEQKAQAAGITYKTLWEWMKDENFVIYLNSQIDKYTNAEVAEVWKALVRKAKMGDISAIKLFFEMKGLYVEKKRHELSGPDGGPIQHSIDVSNLSDDELEKELAQLENLEQG
ncbi:phBC6A51 family helix-turn-helix protein [Sporomusa paucivorans]|uniref:phBC6A51 family helix-turn-helix protein n=1 Tax=Sporomusa paucivorans TaxID=2376 RepID=UPI003570B718